MGKTTRKRYSADFKATVALDAIRAELTMSQLTAKHGIHQTMVNDWRKQATAGLSTLFESKPEGRDKNHEAEIERLHAKIGQLIVERDFLVKVSGR